MAERGTQEHWDANVQAGREGAWVHSDHKDVSAYALGQSQRGWGSKSSSAFGFSSSTPAASASIFTPSSTHSTPAASVGGSGYSGVVGGGRSSSRSGITSSILGLAFFVGLIFGVDDNVAKQVEPIHSAEIVATTIYGISDAIGKKIESMGEGPAFAWAGWGVRWGIAIPIGFAAGAGAFVGNLAVTVGKACVDAWNTNNNRVEGR